MTLSLYFEEFKLASQMFGPDVDVDAEIEDERLKTFESGYTAGWDDAIKAQAEIGQQVTEDLRQSMADFDFTLQEATDQFGTKIAPVLVQILEKILPSIAHATLPLHILEQIQPILASHPDDELIVHVPEQHVFALQRLLEKSGGEMPKVVADEHLGPGQAHLALATAEREIDLDRLGDDILTMITNFFSTLEESSRNE